MSNDLDDWPDHRVAYAMVGLANGAGLVWSAALASVTPSAIMAFCTVAVPALVGAVAYTIKTLGPLVTASLKELSGAWLDYRMARDRMQAGTLSGQIEALTRSLESKAEAEKSARDLAGLNARRVDSMAELLKAQTGKIDDLTARLAAMSAGQAEATKRLNDANAKLHEIRRQAQAELLMRHDAEVSLKDARDEIRQLRARLDGLTTQVTHNSDQLEENARTAAGLNKLGKVIHEVTAPFVEPEQARTAAEPMKEQ